MGDEDEVDAARILRRERRWHESIGMRTEVGVDEESDAAEPEGEARLPEPGERNGRRRKLVRREPLEERRRRRDHAGRSCTFRAFPARSPSAANASACCSSANEWLTRGAVSRRPAAKSSVTQRQAFREAPKTPCTRKCPSTTVSESTPPASPGMPSRTTVPPRRASEIAVAAPS